MYIRRRNLFINGTLEHPLKLVPLFESLNKLHIIVLSIVEYCTKYCFQFIMLGHRKKHVRNI